MAVSTDARTFKYVGNVDENLLCPICAVPFMTPMQTSCRHVFCNTCITTWLQTSNDCPSCRTRLTTPDPDQDQENYFEDDASNIESITTAAPLRPAPTVLIGMLDSIRYQCPNTSQGCTAQLSRDMMESHIIAECLHTLTPCPDKNCEELVPRAKRDPKMCGHRMVECNMCGIEMQQMDVVSHLRDCPENVETCELCHESYNKLRAEEHASSLCPESLTHCIGEKIGCGYFDTRALVNEHLQECPFAKLYGIVGPMESQMKKMAMEYGKLKTDTERLKREVMIAERFKDEFYALQYRLGQVDHKTRLFEHAIARHDESLYSLVSHIQPAANNEGIAHLQPWRYDIEECARNAERVDRLQAMVVKGEMAHANEVYAIKEEVGKMRHQLFLQNIMLQDHVSRSGSGRPNFNLQRAMQQQQQQHDDGGQGSSSSGAAAGGSTVSFASYGHGGEMADHPVRPMSELARGNVKL